MKERAPKIRTISEDAARAALIFGESLWFPTSPRRASPRTPETIAKNTEIATKAIFINLSLWLGA
jgi:hypothetical protein